MNNQVYTDEEFNKFRDLVEAGESQNQLERIRSRLAGVGTAASRCRLSYRPRLGDITGVENE